MPHDYSRLLEGNPDYYPSWEQFYDNNLDYPQNILKFCKSVTPLPYDFYKVIAAYTLIPSALARRVPYLFFYGESGSGKSTFGKFQSKVHGVKVTSSGTSYAAIRNELNTRKFRNTLVHEDGIDKPPVGKTVELNTFMVWEDIDDKTFKKIPQVFSMFKFGYDKATDTIVMSGEIKGTNMSFRCFSPKSFSSIHPIHTIEDYKELRRRMIVIPTKKVDSSDFNFLDIDGINWEGFSSKFDEYWNMVQAEVWLMTNQALKTEKLKGLTNSQKVISLDLITTGVASNIWTNEIEAVQDLKACFDWMKEDVKVESSPLEKLLEDYIKDLEKQYLEVDASPCIYSHQLKNICLDWYEKGYLMDKPSSREIVKIMNQRNYKINKRGQWSKRVM